MGMEKVEARALEPKPARYKRFWVGWSSRRQTVVTPFPKWRTSVVSVPFTEMMSYGYMAVIDAEDRESAWHAVVLGYPDAEEAYVKEKESDFWPPTDRFPRVS